MAKAMNRTGKIKTVPAGLAIAASASMITTLIFTAMIANFLNTEKITWEQAGYWIMGMLFAASFIGGKVGISAIGHQQFMISAMTGFVYWGMLLCITALFFGGLFDAVGVTAGIIGAGSCSAALHTKPISQKRRKKPWTGNR